MLLLIQIKSYPTLNRGNYLHSTMLLLIRKEKIRGYSRISFTFHHASTYTYALSSCKRPLFSFTFHYASTYTERCLTFRCFIYLIYIPLCFYLYGDPESKRLQRKRIYIPLCFYLYVKAHKTNVLILHLHSTMLLLIRSRSIWFPQPQSNLHSTMLLLILLIPEELILIFPNLHSTMLLLIPAIYSMICWSGDSIYIPLCFYLYDNLIHVPVVELPNLHSTMLLLIRSLP